MLQASSSEGEDHPALVTKLDVHPQFVAGPQGETANGGDDGIARKAKARTSRERRYTQYCLGKAERSTRTDARSSAEWNVSVSHTPLGVLGKKPLGNEMVGLPPEFTVPMKEPRGDHDK